MDDKAIKRKALGEQNVHTVSKYHTYHIKILLKNRGESYIFTMGKSSGHCHKGSDQI